MLLFVLSPAKKLDFDSPLPPDLPHTGAAFAQDAQALVQRLAPGGVEYLARLMGISESLAALNAARYAAFDAQPERQALFAFDGDVYAGLQAKTLGPDDLHWAQQHLRILSGLYGVLRPLDRIRAHRLEMGTRLAGPHGANLYQFWGNRLRAHLAAHLHAAAEEENCLVNLASQEYFRALDQAKPPMPVVHCAFEDFQGGQYKVVGIHAKRARGLMARFAVQRRVRRLQDLHAFDLEGYAFATNASSAQRLVFRRRR